MTHRIAPDRPHRTAKRPEIGWLLRAACIGLLSLALVPGTPLSAKVKIEHDPVKKSKSGHRIEIDAKIVDKKSNIKDARAYFKSGHDNRFWFAPMQPSGGQGYLGILPAPALGADTVQYRIYAVNGADDFVKTQLYSIEIEDDEEALERLEQKEPTEVEIDLDQIEQAYDLATQGGEPDPSSQVEVRNDVPGSENPSQITGFQDYIVLAEAPPAAAGAGLAGATVVSASGGGLGAGAITGITLGGLAGVAVAVEAADSSDDDGGSQANVTLLNNGVDNIHICTQCTTADFTPGNRLSPGERRTISVSTGSVNFLAGRNGARRASATCTVTTDSNLTVRYTETSFFGSASLLCE